MTNVTPFKRQPIFQEDGSICDPKTGEIRSLDPSKPESVPLTPNISDISAHLYAMFSPAFVQAYPDAWFEIAYGHAASGGAIHEAQNYSVFQLKEAAEFAEARNKAGWNMYVGPALRHGKQPGDGRAKDKDVVTSAYAWAEYDRDGDDKRIDDILKANGLTPAIVVTTGETPHPRRHLYFKLDDAVTPGNLKAANDSLVKLLGGDAVQAPAHVMRLAGTINHPTPKKAAKGYIPELTTFRINNNPSAYKAELIKPVSGATSDPYDEYGENAPGQGKTNAELLKLLKDGQIEDWHINMRSAVACMVGRSMSDRDIKIACAAYCEGEMQDTDLKKLIDTARKRYDKPDPHEVPLDRVRNPAPPATPIHATPYTWKDPQTIPQREWLYGQLLVREIVSATISPAALGSHPWSPLRRWRWFRASRYSASRRQSSYGSGFGILRIPKRRPNVKSKPRPNITSSSPTISVTGSWSSVVATRSWSLLAPSVTVRSSSSPWSTVLWPRSSPARSTS